ncbi:hypothetical protein AAIB33_13875 [Microbacterium sp. AZCO]|uniref:hypothetical protein n=1 Tax=Microbacterium sp. AZCO TaxID=3142976 RepID=UPI0031F3B412
MSDGLYRDPIYDGATDPAVVRGPDAWVMFYTQRRATHPDPGPGVAWVHGSRIGVATSPDGLAWTYAGTLEPTEAGLALEPGPPPRIVDDTHWAPDVIHDGVRWRMYLTEIAGVPDRWDGHPRHIVEYVSDDLVRWRRAGTIPLSSDRVIDAAVARCPDGLWRLWFKDEAADSVTKVAASADLASWHVEGTAIGGRPHEGPFVFELGAWWWMITDEWRGLAVHRSSDAVEWHRQGLILAERDGAGVEIGRHGSVVVDGPTSARLFFFTHPWWDGSEIADAAGRDARRSVVHVAALSVFGDELICDR